MEPKERGASGGPLPQEPCTALALAPQGVPSVTFARSLLASCSQVVSCLFNNSVRFYGFLHDSLFCVSESMLYLDGKRHFDSMSIPVNLRKNYLVEP